MPCTIKSTTIKSTIIYLPSSNHHILSIEQIGCASSNQNHCLMLLPYFQYANIDLPASHSGSNLDFSTTLLLAHDNVATNPLSPSFPSFFNDLLANLDLSQHPVTTLLASYCLVTAADMVPFVPCQPLAIALGAKLGFALAFPITAIGQTTAGILAFSAARKASDTDLARKALELNPEAVQKLEELRTLTSAEEQGDGKVLLALIGLRLAPFFPFSAGNYLLGGTTAVPLRLYVLATLMGCIASNFLSVTIGAGGAMIFSMSDNLFL